MPMDSLSTQGSRRLGDRRLCRAPRPRRSRQALRPDSLRRARIAVSPLLFQEALRTQASALAGTVNNVLSRNIGRARATCET